MPRLDRKQERIVRTLEGPLFVSAGAGSGKTFTLTQRVLYALTPGSRPRELWADPEVPEAFLDSIDQVLAITFTDKAAAELKERIRAALIQTGLAREAERVDGAWISTIHGMCARIIRAHALDLGVDPAFYRRGLRRRPQAPGSRARHPPCHRRGCRWRGRFRRRPACVSARGGPGGLPRPRQPARHPHSPSGARVRLAHRARCLSAGASAPAFSGAVRGVS